MIYFLNDKDDLKTFEHSKFANLVYQDLQDVRNYAFLYVYPNNKIDSVIRTRNLAGHYYAIQPLLKISSDLKEYYHNFFEDDVAHFDLDTNICQNGVLTIYYCTADLTDEEAFGYINVPEHLTVFQKDFLRKHRYFFERYEEILINQYNSNTTELESLNEFGDGTFLSILDNLSEPVLESENVFTKR